MALLSASNVSVKIKETCYIIPWGLCLVLDHLVSSEPINFK